MRRNIPKSISFTIRFWSKLIEETADKRVVESTYREIDAFRTKFEEQLMNEYNRASQKGKFEKWEIAVFIDYNPCLMLKTALDAAGLSRIEIDLPWKYRTRTSAIKVTLDKYTKESTCEIWPFNRLREEQAWMSFGIDSKP